MSRDGGSGGRQMIEQGCRTYLGRTIRHVRCDIDVSHQFSFTRHLFFPIFMYITYDSEKDERVYARMSIIWHMIGPGDSVSGSTHLPGSLTSQNSFDI